MTNNISSLSMTLLVLVIILLLIIIAGVCLIIYKRKKTRHHKDDDNYNCEVIDKEINKYKQLRKQLKQKLADSKNFDSDKKQQELQKIIDEEIVEYRNDQLLKVEQQIEQHKNEILKRTILCSMQPLHLKVINESSVAYVPIEDRIKALLIGKKGQNIKRLNELTGCNVAIDRVSPYVEVSCPNPVDRTLAVNIINHLIKSQAFDITAINNVYNKEKRLLTKSFYETGKEYIKKLNISVANDSIYEYVGRLKFRWSFSQNVLDHCYETALICE